MLEKYHLRKQASTLSRISIVQQSIRNYFDYRTSSGVDENMPVIIYAHWKMTALIEKAVKDLKDKRILKVVPDFPTLIYAEIDPDTPQKVKSFLRYLWNQQMQPRHRFKKKLLRRVLQDFIGDLAKKDPYISEWAKDFYLWYKHRYTPTHLGAEEYYLLPVKQRNKGNK
jgi:hypothetical protein